MLYGFIGLQHYVEETINMPLRDLKRKHRVAEADSMFSGGEKTISGIDNLLKKTLAEGLSIVSGTYT